ncbi:MAG: hypothetical protein HZB76_05085 [Chlamydiae bacterium]|nr:hypothetical protein [Chlamydiota bacterium]
MPVNFSVRGATASAAHQLNPKNWSPKSRTVAFIMIALSAVVINNGYYYLCQYQPELVARTIAIINSKNIYCFPCFPATLIKSVCCLVRN